MPHDQTTRGVVGRRSLLLGGVAVAAGVPLLAACSSAGAPAVSAADAERGVLAKTADVEVGGGVVNAEARIVVTQPTQGEFKAFTAICTHAGCTVGSVQDGEIICPCHGSRFSAADGSVINGPAQAPLSPKTVRVDGGDVVLG